MNIVKWIKYVILPVAAFALFGVLLITYFKYAVPHWSETPDIRRKVERIKRTPRSDVIAMQVSSSNTWHFTLQRPEDDQYIDQLLSSLRQMTVVHAKGGAGYGDLIVVIVKGHPYNQAIRIEGRFAPDDPFVSNSLRSADLGKVVHDILKHKGIKPKKQ